MNRRRTTRAIISVVVVGLLVYSLWQVIPSITNTDPGHYDSNGDVLAVKETPKGSRVVLIKPDGKEVEVPTDVDNANDTNPSWSSDGERIYFVSDRDKQEPHIFRWNPEPARLFGLFSRPAVERRTIDKRSKGHLYFDVPGGSSKTALMISGGTVQEFNPKDGSTRQVLPPTTLNGAGSADSGAGGQFDTAYSQIGSSFLSAHWLKNKEWIAAIMRAEDGGEVLVMQNMTNDKAPPQPFSLVGDHIDMDIDPNTGDVVAAIINCRYINAKAIPPNAPKKDGKAVPPFKNGVIRLTSTGFQGIIASNDNKQCFRKPRVSPDGQDILVIVGSYDPLTLSQKAEYLIAAGPGVKNENHTQGLVQGEVTEASWHPNGTDVVFAIKAKDSRDCRLGIVSVTGTEHNKMLTKTGVYSSPSFSPASK